MDWKKLAKKLLYPPVWVMALLTVISGAGLAFVFIKGLDTSAVAYLLYVLAFYTLCVLCIFCALVLPKGHRKILQKIHDNPLGHRYMTDRVFRTQVSLYLSLGINLMYVGINVLSWYLYRSWWFVCLAVYYTTLSFMRFLLVRHVRVHQIGNNRRSELMRAISCSAILLTLNFFLSGAVLMILYQNRGYEYDGIMIYVMAMYTFYMTTHAIIDIIKYRKLNTPVMTTAKMISLAAALVSMLNLETAMFAQFGTEMAKKDQQLMIMLTGAGVSILVVVMAVLMIVRCIREIKTIKS